MNTSARIDEIASSSRWATTIGQLCDQFGGDVQTGPFGSQLHASDYVEEGTPVVMPQDMVQGSISSERIARVGPKHVRELQRHALRAGDIVYSRRGDVGRFAVVTKSEEGWLCGTGSIRIRLNTPNILVDYVRHYLQQEMVANWLKHRAKGITMPNLNTDVVRALPFVYPPLEEQRRIAEVLDRAEALRAKRRAALAQLDTLALAVFDELFGTGEIPPIIASDKGARHPKGWHWQLLTDVSRLATGHTPDRERPDYWQGAIPWISLTDIRSLDGTVAARTSQNVSELGIEHSSAVELPAGTVCFSRTASIGFVTIMGRPMATSQDFVNWVPGPQLDSSYLMWALIRSRPQLRAISSGSTHKTIYVRVVEHFRVLTPPIEIQKRFARSIEAIDALRERYRESLEQLDVLFSALQARAFSGELTHAR